MLEIACFNALSAIAAASAGADRIELCADYAAGGITPPLPDLIAIREAHPNIPVNLMIRPRGGDFVYTDDELSQMSASIEEFKPYASGFVFGVLNGDNEVDMERNSQLVKAAGGLSCTFHRAFDIVEDKDQAAEGVISCGFTSVLTSGGGKNAIDGVEVIARLQKKFGGRISYIAGGGVRSTNVWELKKHTSVQWYHSAAITGGDEQVDEKEVLKIKQALEGM